MQLDAVKESGATFMKYNPRNIKKYLNEDEQIVIKGLCPCKKQSQRCFNFVVVGMTGSGKTTLIDSLVNYCLGVEFYDKFRYKLIDERKIHK